MHAQVHRLCESQQETMKLEPQMSLISQMGHDPTRLSPYSSVRLIFLICVNL